MTIDKRFQEYFDALDRSGDADRCYLCRRLRLRSHQGPRRWTMSLLGAG